MFKTITVLSLTIFLAGCSAPTFYTRSTPAPKLVSINIIDRNGMSETITSPDRLKQYTEVDFLAPQGFEKVLRVYERDCTGDIRAFISGYHENGLIKQYLEVLNARARGYYREWHENGVLKIEAFLVGGEPDLTTEAQRTWVFEGSSLMFDECGRKKAEIPYVSGKLHGNSLYYHDSGSLWKKIPFCQGEISGTVEVYLESGELFQKGTYLNGKKEGCFERFWPGQDEQASLASQEIYKNDRLWSANYYDKEGVEISSVSNGEGKRAVFGKERLSELQQIQQGQIEGLIMAFGPQGELVRQWNLQNNMKNGEEIEYYPIELSKGKQIPQLSMNWNEGKIQGSVKTWYVTGAQESQKEMSQNVKNGMLTAWYRDGSLMMIERYDMDKLIRGEYFEKGESSPISQVIDGSGVATLFDPDGHFLRRVKYNKSHPE